jgi:hypothetical protein
MRAFGPLGVDAAFAEAFVLALDMDGVLGEPTVLPIPLFIVLPLLALPRGSLPRTDVVPPATIRKARLASDDFREVDIE